MSESWAKNPSKEKRVSGSLLGAQIGDALAMPVHWYYDTAALERDYGEVRDFLAPREPHPDSILWRSHYLPPSDKADILGDEARHWGQRDIHYHRNLGPGDNTLNLQLAALHWRLLRERGCFDEDLFLDAFIAFMQNPKGHRDTYVEEAYRGFFQRWAKGVPPRQCGVEEKHIGGLCALFPVLALYADDPVNGTEHALRRLALTHPGSKMEEAGHFLCRLYYSLLSGDPLGPTVAGMIKKGGFGFLHHPFAALLDFPARQVLVHELGTVCYVERALPAVIYLLLKHGDDPETALIENTMAGGDNCYRGAVLGTLLGCAHGTGAWPKRWIRGLSAPMVAPE